MIGCRGDNYSKTHIDLIVDLQIMFKFKSLILTVSLTICLFVDLPRVLNSMPSRLYLPKGLMGRIDCPVESNPPLTIIIWSKGNRPIDFTQVKHMKINKEGTLIIKPVILSDEGLYSCQPYSTLGEGSSSPTVHVFVRGRVFSTFCVFFCFNTISVSSHVYLECLANQRNMGYDISECGNRRAIFGNVQLAHEPKIEASGSTIEC